MIHIAICDDDVAMTSMIEELLLSIGKEQRIQVSCDVFFDGSTLIESVRQGTYYDLIYLDIEMPHMSGICAATSIRDMEVPALIVYLSGYETYLKELFDTEPFRFLSKPIDTEAFHAVFMAAYQRIRQHSEYFSFSYNRSFFKLPLNNICYFESQSRIIHIYIPKSMTAKGGNAMPADRFYGKMNDIEKQLLGSNSRFIRIHQSYLVNFDYIKSMNFTNVTMSDGTMLQISEDRQKNVRAQFCAMAGVEVRNGA